MAKEKTHYRVKDGSLVQLKSGRYGFVVSSTFTMTAIDRSVDPFLYVVSVNGVDHSLIREAFNFIQGPSGHGGR